MKNLILLLVFLISCSSKEYKNGTSIIDIEDDKLAKITCFLISLEGEKEIYTIQGNELKAFGKVTKLDPNIIKNLEKIPKEIKSKNQKYGCGICVDGVDFKFIFNFTNEEKILEIQPSNKEMSNEIKEYTDILISLYNQQLEG